MESIKIFETDLKNFPIQYVLEEEGVSYEIGDNKESHKLFEEFDYLELLKDGRLYGVKGNTSFDIIIDVDKDAGISDEDWKAIKEMD